MNGGQVAVSGFWLQALWVVLDGLDRDDWRAVTLEPDGDDKVDVRWSLVQGTRLDQVKSTTRGFRPSVVQSWAEDLERQCAGDELRLVLVGAPTGEIPAIHTVGRVRVESHVRDEQVLESAVAFRLGKLCQDDGIVLPYSRARRAAELLIGLLLTSSRRGERWPREKIMGEIYELARNQAANSHSEHHDPRTRAEMVQRAMVAHGMRRASDCVRRGGVTVFRTCQWPPPPHADPDGYSEAKVESASGPGDCEATGCNAADRIVADCEFLELSYTFGSQGYFEHLEAYPSAPWRRRVGSRWCL